MKLKKRHEICEMAEFVRVNAERSHCRAVVDFGSGLGHLIRILSYKYNLEAVGIEMQGQLTEEARSVYLVCTLGVYYFQVCRKFCYMFYR